MFMDLPTVAVAKLVLFTRLIVAKEHLFNVLYLKLKCASSAADGRRWGIARWSRGRWFWSMPGQRNASLRLSFHDDQTQTVHVLTLSGVL